MNQKKISVNLAAHKLVKQLCDHSERFNIAVKKTDSGATLIDAGISVEGGFSAGRIVTEICMGGCGTTELSWRRYGDTELPSISVYSDNPVLATLGSQFAGWQIQSGGYFAIGSGPARALALKPREIYDEIRYKDEADVAIVVLETEAQPPNGVVELLSRDTHIPPEKLYIILTPTTSIAGSTQISGRIVETGVHKLKMLGFNPNCIKHAFGYAPISPVHPKFSKAMGRTNDAILYGGVTYYAVEYDDDEQLQSYVDKAPSKTSKDYGQPFNEILKGAKNDFYKIDPNIFAPAVIIVNNVASGALFRAGEVNPALLKQSINL